jgi:V8-like Glu-specific endopeptidase
MSTAIRPTSTTTEPRPVLSRLGMPFPPDNRARVLQTTQAPWSAIGLVSARFPNGDVCESTGFAIDGRCVVTAAHGTFDLDRGGNALHVEFEPARNGQQALFGRFTASTWFRPAEYPVSGAIYDYALVKLARALPSEIGRYELWAAGDQDLNGPEFQIAGYPDDKAPDNSLWYDSGRLQSVDTRVLRYRISTSGGQSGAAVSTFLDTSLTRVVGIHSGASYDRRSNQAVRVTEEVIEQIGLWRNS